MKMKNINITLIVFIFALSCNDDFLDRESKSSIPENMVFEDPELIQLFVNNIYSDVHGFDHELYDNITDESRNFWGGDLQNVDRAEWFDENIPMKYYAFNTDRNIK